MITLKKIEKTDAVYRNREYLLRFPYGSGVAVPTSKYYGEEVIQIAIDFDQAYFFEHTSIGLSPKYYFKQAQEVYEIIYT